MPILAIVLDLLEYRAIIKQNEHIKKRKCPSATLSFVLMHSSDWLYQALRFYVCIFPRSTAIYNVILTIVFDMTLIYLAILEYSSL